MISVEEAQAKILSLCTLMESEPIELAQASGRVLAKPVIANRNQPPFPASAMDGYAVRSRDALKGAKLKVIGTSAAGARSELKLEPGEAIRIFTGAVVPEGADRVVIQEDVTREGEYITLNIAADGALHIRPEGADFKSGEVFHPSHPLTPADLMQIAAMGAAQIEVYRKPDIAIISTGDELVWPGEPAGPDQIYASNGFALKALLEAHGARCQLLPIARDTKSHLSEVLSLGNKADMIITIGGASVGDHDLVQSTAEEMGLEQSFYKVAMRPGKPLSAGKLGHSLLIGLPGNPVSALVCGYIFVLPALKYLTGQKEVFPEPIYAKLSHDLEANGPRAHYMRASLEKGEITAQRSQDSALTSIFALSDILAIRPPNDPARKAGEMISYICL